MYIAFGRVVYGVLTLPHLHHIRLIFIRLAFGKTVALRLQTDPLRSLGSVVVFSSSRLPKDKEKAETLGAHDYLVKPDSDQAIASQRRGVASLDGVLTLLAPRKMGICYGGSSL